MTRIVLTPPFGATSLEVDGRHVPLRESLAIANHSPTGFGWGYGGSGPAQTALAILLAAATPEQAQRHYQAFKSEHVARWPLHEPVDVELDVPAWLERQEWIHGHAC